MVGLLSDILAWFGSQMIFCVVLMSTVIALSVGVAPSRLAEDVESFAAFRLPHFDLQGNQYGSRARRVYADISSVRSTGRSRRCVVVWWNEFPVESLSELIRNNVAAVILVLPDDLRQLSSQDREKFLEIEQILTTSTISIPIYVAIESPVIRKLMHLAEDKFSSSFNGISHVLYSLFLERSYKLVSKVQRLTVDGHFALENLMVSLGQLFSANHPKHVPTVAIVAHYDSFGLAPGRSFGYDSNGTGVMLLLELLRFFSKLYRKADTRPSYNLIFLLSAGGKLNYIGTRQWIEDLVEKREKYGDNSHTIEFAVCLDSLIGNGKTLYIHVSKAQKETTPVARFQRKLMESAQFYNLSIELVQKKINLADERLSWEHEPFNIRRFHSFTLSGFASAQDRMRRSILDVLQSNSVELIVPRYLTVLSGLFRYIYNISATDVDSFIRSSDVREHVELWNWYLMQYPRGQQLMLKLKEHPIGSAFWRFVDHFADQAVISVVGTDRRHPEFVLYNGVEDVILANETSTALFDLLASLFIMAYLFAVYLAIVFLSRRRWMLNGRNAARTKVQ